MLVVEWRDYAYLVPFVEWPGFYFLKTIIRSRKATRDYLRKRTGHEESSDDPET